MKKRAKPAKSLGTQVDQQIKALVAQENAEALLMGGISAHDGSLSPIEAAILALDHDTQSMLRLLQQIKNQTLLFETFQRSMAVEILKIKQQLRS